jgi:hypothetical protein
MRTGLPGLRAGGGPAPPAEFVYRNVSDLRRLPPATACRAMPALSLLSAPWRASLRFCLGGLAVVAWAMGAQAAVVQPSVDLLQPGGAAPAMSTLERALTVDTNTSQRNLDLLLDARRAGDAAGTAPMRTGDVPDNRRALPVAEPRSGLVPLGLQGRDSVTAPGATERREWQNTAPAGRPADLAGHSQAGARAGGGLPEGEGGRTDRSGMSGEAGELSELVAETLQFLREHRLWLLGGLLLLALLAVSFQAIARRR